MQLTLYLLKPDRPHDTWGLRESADEFVEVPTRPIDNLDVRLRVRQSESHPPRWLSDLLGIVADEESLSNLLNRHSAALLLVRYGDYQFVLAYGTAHHAIDRSEIQPGFGLRVVANSVAASRVISADTRELGSRARSQRTVLPSAGPLYDLGIEPADEWIRELEGKPTVDFANTASGADCLKLRIRDFGLSKLESKLAQIVEKYESLEYKKDYGFLDHFRRVTNAEKATRDDLERRLDQLLEDRSPDVGFAGPDILEPLGVDHYVLTYKRARSSELDELTHESAYEALNALGASDPLHEVKVEAFDSSGDVVGEVRPLIDYIVADILMDGERFTLSAGVWFRVDQSYVESLQRSIDAIPDVTDSLSLDDWSLTSYKSEGTYNDSLASRGWRVLDRKNFPIEKPNQKVEVCDLLTPEKQFICVKRMTKSATMSHLFAQGLVSAQLFAANADGYQDRVVKQLRKIDKAATYGRREDWSVVYAIATDKPGPLSESMFFFSKVALERTVRQLTALGLKAVLARITLKP